MKKNKHLYHFLLLFILFLGTGCSEKLPQLKVIKYDNIKILTLNKDDIRVSADVTIRNNKMFKIKITNPKLCVYSSDNFKLGDLILPGKISLPGKKEAVITVELVLMNPEVQRHLKISDGKAVLKFKGNADVKYLLFNKNLTINRTQEISFKEKVLKEKIISLIKEQISKMKLIQVEKVHIDRFSLTETHFVLNFTVENEFALKARLNSYESKLFINNKFVGDGKLKAPVTLSPDFKEAKGQLVFQIENWQMLISSFNLLIAKKLEFTTQGNLSVELFNQDINIPYNFQGKLSIDPSNIFKLETQ